MSCSGGVDFKLEYYGRKTGVQALVSSDLKDEILIGWRALQRLEIISENFPQPVTRCKKTEAPMIIDDPESRLKAEIKKFSDVFNADGPLKTMKGG